MSDLSSAALVALAECDIETKLAQVQALCVDWGAGRLTLEPGTAPEPIAVPVPGRPERPILVSPFEVERRKVFTPAGRATLVHALTHIEFNAINLALDAVYRFRGLPREFYSDWLKVAHEEAQHFALLRDHLRILGFEYGDFTAHNGLWEMALKTAHDPLVRLALVPRVLEARGLDANPALVNKFKSGGDQRMVEILEIILRDEIGHVAIGNRWYAYLCERRGIDPIATFRTLLQEHAAPRIRPPFHLPARRAAGFSEAELALLQDFAGFRSREAPP
jgi:uncharacterized ferritin-like protein (DUF455 family)